MTRVTAYLAALLMPLSLVACAGRNAQTGQSPKPAQTQREWTAQVEKTDPPPYVPRNTARSDEDLEEAEPEDDESEEEEAEDAARVERQDAAPDDPLETGQ